jgi:hypothetical protein
MRQFMPTLMCLVLSTAPIALAQSTAVSTVAASTIAAYSLNAQLGRYAGSGLSLTDCQARMAEMEAMLGASGYGRRSTRSWTDGSVYARWYDAGHDTTVMAVAMPSGDGRGYSLDAYTVEGQVHWNDYLPVP